MSIHKQKPFHPRFNKNFGMNYLFLLCFTFLVFVSAQTTTDPSNPSQSKSTPQSGKEFQTDSPWTLATIKDKTATPQERYCHVAAVCHDLMVIHGGAGQTDYGTDTILSDTWVYNNIGTTWYSLREPKGTASASATSATKGPIRVYHSMSTTSETLELINGNTIHQCTLLMFGGSSAESGNVALNDENTLYSLNLQYDKVLNSLSGSWTLVMPEGGVKPEPRNEHVSVAHDNKYYIFGGMAGTDVQSLKQYQDVWMYDVVTNTWTKQIPEANPNQKNEGSNAISVYGPSRRFSLAAAIALPVSELEPKQDTGTGTESGGKSSTGVTEPSLLIFGGSNVDVYRQGQTNVNYMDDLWSFGLTSKIWTQLSSPSAAMERTYMSLVVVSSQVIAFGGMSQKNTERGPVHYVFNDVMKYDLIDQSWSRSSERGESRQGGETPSVRFGHTAVAISNGDMLVFAGRFNSIYKDVWALNTTILHTSTLDPEPSRESTYAQYLYYVLAIIAMVSVCSCVFLASMRQTIVRQQQLQPARVQQPVGSALNGGASESLIQSLLVETYEAPQPSPCEMDMEEGGARNDEIASQDSQEGDQCSICFDTYEQGDQLRVLPCKHRFHLECVDPWLKTNKSCPLCKHEVDKVCVNQSQAFLKSVSNGPSVPLSQSDQQEEVSIESTSSMSSQSQIQRNQVLPVEMMSMSTDRSMDFIPSRHGVNIQTAGDSKQDV